MSLWHRTPTGDEPPYAADHRRHDRGQGRRDGQKRIPAYSTVVELLERGTRISTPYQERLSRSGMWEIGRAFDGFLGRRNGQLARIGNLIRALERDRHQARVCEARLAQARQPLTAVELRPQSHQERALPPEVLRTRREQQRERRITEARTALDSAEGTVVSRVAEIDDVYRSIDHDFVVSQESARHIGDYYVLRINTYWDALTQHHPDGRHLASMLPLVEPLLPPWLDATCRRGVISPASSTPGRGTNESIGPVTLS